MLWAAFRVIEQEQLSSAAAAAELCDAGGEDARAASEKSVAAAAARVRALFRRQLSVVLAATSSTLAEYAAWEASAPAGGTGVVPADVAAAAAKSAAAASARMALEAPLKPAEQSDAASSAARGCDPALLAAYVALITHEEREGDPGRLIVAFERALAEFPFTTSLWERYTRTLAARLGGTVTEAAFDRALRTCAWVGSLWAAALRAAERAGDAARVEALHSSAHAAPLMQPEDHTQVGLARMDAARRAAELSPLRAAAQAALDGADTVAGGSHVDPALRVAAYWAHCEVAVAPGAGGEAAARQVWEALLKRPAYGAAAETWLAYAAHERATGGAAAARRVFKRCYARRLDCAAGVPPAGAASGQEALCLAWLRLEREAGSADDYAAAETKVIRRICHDRMPARL